MTTADKAKIWFSALSKREQVVVLALGFVLVAFVWDQLFLSPLQAKSARLKAEISSVNKQILSQNEELQQMMQLSEDDPNLDLRNRESHLNAQTGDLKSKIAGLTDNLIPPKQMSKIMEQVLHQETGLVLKKVNSLESKRLTLEEGTEQTSGDKHILFKHGVEMHLEGDYFETIRYLKALEDLSWSLIWSNVEYEVIEFPNAKIRIKINTLSEHSGWIGA